MTIFFHWQNNLQKSGNAAQTAIIFAYYYQINGAKLHENQNHFLYFMFLCIIFGFEYDERYNFKSSVDPQLKMIAQKVNVERITPEEGLALYKKRRILVLGSLATF